MRILGVIPARFGSSRLEGKPLKDICGKPMIQYVYEAARKSRLMDEVIVATDDQRIVEVVKNFGGVACLTSREHKTGTDRVAEVASHHEVNIVVNIQGDEPLIDPVMVDEVIQPFLEDTSLFMSTLCVPIREEERLHSPHVVKVVFDKKGYALYFSRSLIPYPRNREVFQAYEHIGIYAYHKDFLMDYVRMQQSVLEVTESLEQLRVIESGFRIKVAVSSRPYEGVSVDTQDDLERVREIVSKRQSNS